MSISPKIWGPSAWLLLHTTAAKMRTHADVALMRSFVEGLVHLLPCTKCRASFAMHLATLPIPNTPRDVTQWVYDMHNRVNLSADPNMFAPPAATKVFDVYKKKARKADALYDFSVFLAALADSHPGHDMRKAYANSLHNLFVLLEHFYQVSAPKSPIRSRRAFTTWLGVSDGPQHMCNKSCAA
jgi:hypothetical protein